MAMKSNDIVSENIVEFMSSDLRICEMVALTDINSGGIDVPVSPQIDMDIILADDDDPKFVNVEIIRAGISSGNNRRYNNNVVAEINNLVPGTQGFFGHPDPSKFGFEFREPQCIYVGSLVDHMPDGTDRCIAKAYLFKSSPLREWVPKSIAAGNPMTVSINGKADVMRNYNGNDTILEVIHMTDLESVDWANPGTEGMETSKAMSVVREMNNNEGGIHMPELNAQDIIKNATVTEFKAFNPDGYKNILAGVTVQELVAVNPVLVDAIKESAKVTELAYTVGGKTESVKVTELQLLVNGYEDKITTLQNDVHTAKVTEYKNRKVGELVPDQYREKILSRVTGNTEADIDKSIESEIAYVREMGGMVNVPAGTYVSKLGNDDVKSAVSSLFGHKKEEK